MQIKKLSPESYSPRFLPTVLNLNGRLVFYVPKYQYNLPIKVELEVNFSMFHV